MKSKWMKGSVWALGFVLLAGIVWQLGRLKVTPGHSAPQTASLAPMSKPPSPLAQPAAASHGELTVDGFPLTVTNKAIAPDPGGKVVPITLSTYQVEWPVAPGQTITAWTFGGQVPGPVLRVRQGDVVEFTLINKDSQVPHSMDFHSAETPMSRDYVDAAPGRALRYYWKANKAGVYMYHCGTPPALMHIAAGMYGAIIVDPKAGWGNAREYVLVQSEMYADPQDYGKMQANQPSWVVFNGAVGRYTKEQPLVARPGELVRLHVVNAGPSNFSAFHVVGTIFEKAYPNGTPKNVEHDMQTVTIPPGGSYTVEFRAPEPGNYAIVTHSFADVAKGAVATLTVSPDAPTPNGLMPYVAEGAPGGGPIGQ